MSSSLNPRERVNLYLESRNIPPDLAFLGEGTDGSVWLTRQRTAVKVLFDSRQFEAEVECYRRLQGVNVIAGYAVPQLVDWDAAVLAIEMTTVRPPYVLDFGKAYLDRAPDFSKETWDYLYKEIRQVYGERYNEVMRVARALQQRGIYYYDIKPKNILPRDWNPSLDGPSGDPIDDCDDLTS